jgi:hypothetical protein
VGSPNKSKSRKVSVLLAMFAAILVVLVLLGLGIIMRQWRQNPSDHPGVNSDEWLILNPDFQLNTPASGAPYVTGFIFNNSDTAIFGLARVSFAAFDRDDAPLGSCQDSTDTIPAFGEWRFRAICPEHTAFVRPSGVVSTR